MTHRTQNDKRRWGRADWERVVEQRAQEMARGVELERLHGSEAYWSGDYKRRAVARRVTA